ncbi:BA75_01091T0 [Komagataella pastoris]|uniref:BA75_01091T0 n=1 Tax=Komagataella pastoris TaxID=4922 RepID=A0A1B2J931_PICPA|nr:BA75_01091T0 [Komagataella pastoris]
MLLTGALCLLLASHAGASPLSRSYHDVKTAASVARTLVHRESLTQLNSIYQSGELQGVPVSFVEYYADCFNDGNPLMLLVDISTSQKNIAQGSPYSLSIKVGDHQLADKKVNGKYPGETFKSTAGSPRVSITGKLHDVTEQVSHNISLTKCFVERHHDSLFWIPGKEVAHSSKWWKFDVESVYFVGGFGNMAYIGEIPLEEYLSASLLDEEEYLQKLDYYMHSNWEQVVTSNPNHSPEYIENIKPHCSPQKAFEKYHNRAGHIKYHETYGYSKQGFSYHEAHHSQKTLKQHLDRKPSSYHGRYNNRNGDYNLKNNMQRCGAAPDHGACVDRHMPIEFHQTDLNKLELFKEFFQKAVRFF